MVLMLLPLVVRSCAAVVRQQRLALAKVGSVWLGALGFTTNVTICGKHECMPVTGVGHS